jgi:hypothetical protein
MELFHLVSFSSTIGQAANEVAALTGAMVTLHDHPGADVPGFSLSAAKFTDRFKFSFTVTPTRAIRELVAKASHLVLGREIVDRVAAADGGQPSGVCIVCGSRDVADVLDLGHQPLANDFRGSPDEAAACPRFPLKLQRCRRCQHAQLTTIVGRAALFSNYSYRSGTSRTLDKYFEWLAMRVDADVRRLHPPASRRPQVLELACNDGTQLSHFRRLGWDTYGVDPAANLAEIARGLGHTVAVGLWGAGAQRFEEVPGMVDAIVAQNVLAHVPDPNAFLRACAARMHDATLLYVQTSQCEMFANGQFDTIYHEHISFFSSKSFDAAARNAGLRIVRYEITDIHGGSCFVVMSKSKAALSDGSLERALTFDESRGMSADLFYAQFRASAFATRKWMNSVLESAASQGVDIVGYGAAAKGMVLLTYLLSARPRFEMGYVVDDAPLKQGMFCPGTRIPIARTEALGQQRCGRDMLVVVFSWNFWDEVRGRIVAAMRENSARCKRGHVWVLLPFPTPKLVSLSMSADPTVPAERAVIGNPFRPPSLPLATLLPRRKVVMVTHFYNEEFLLPYFINHHAPMFDRAILIDWGSNDSSVEVIRRLAPSSWTVVPSKHPESFHHQRVDEEVVEWENKFEGWWKISLTTAEFFVHHDLRGYLMRLDQTRHRVVRVRSAIIVGSEATPLKRFEQLLQQRNEYFARPQTYIPSRFTDYRNEASSFITMFSRFIHRFGREFYMRYDSGRHGINPSITRSVNRATIPMAQEGILAKLQFSPWPEIKGRKLQIGPRIPVEHLKAKYGAYHNSTSAELEKWRDQMRSEHLLTLSSVFARCGSDVVDALHLEWYQTFAGAVSLRGDCGMMPALVKRYDSWQLTVLSRRGGRW